MNGTEVLDYAREAVYVMLLMAGPLMAVALLVGLIIALFQALTQIQEMTLVFVPKIVAIFFALILLLPFMASTLGSFMNKTMESIIIVGGSI
ncbi:MAG: flagellar biosynthesis protein FliQ [Rhizobiales bacterium]|nr:flagellar biosynthesis protein FliQ [Hyphomicrobiales bacterium]NRB13814.1 flagellar biosynthesis protein FliQ [Hyphomicrobiales bacterium]